MRPTRHRIEPMLAQAIWYDRHPLSIALIPLAACFRLLVALRRKAYRNGLLPVIRLPVPVIVVGNISVGGTGKTPLVAWLVRFLQQQGYTPGIIGRGYRGRASTWPQSVTPESDPALVGDEPVLLARRCCCPIAVGPDRVAAAQYLLRQHKVNILVSDDGLQHYRLARNLEIAVVDGNRRHGNGRCLPAGPLREPEQRLQEVDMVVTYGAARQNEFPLQYVSLAVRSLQDENDTSELAQWHGKIVHALAGIGNPERFFTRLRSEHITLYPHIFPDHHPYRPEDIRFGDGLPVLMTEKDAVKCRRFAGPEHWYLPIAAQVDAAFEQRLLTLLKKMHGQKTA